MDPLTIGNPDNRQLLGTITSISKRFSYLHVLGTVCTIHAVCTLSYNVLLHAIRITGSGNYILPKVSLRLPKDARLPGNP